MTKVRKNYVEEIKGIINNAVTEEELMDLHNYIIARLKTARTLRAQDMKQTLKVGVMVEWNGRKGYHKGTVLKINRTRAQVKEVKDFGYGLNWMVPMNMLKIIKG
jgi:hypothetical protein